MLRVSNASGWLFMGVMAKVVLGQWSQAKRVLISVVLCLSVTMAMAQTADELNAELVDYQEQLQQLAEGEQTEQTRTLLNRMIVSIQTQTRLLSSLKTLTAEANQQPTQLEDAESRLNQFEASEVDLPWTGRESLAQKLVSASALVLEAEQSQALAESQARQIQQRIERLPGLLSEKQAQLESLTEQTESTGNADVALQQQLNEHLLNEYSLAVQALELESLVLPGRDELASVNLDYQNLMLARWQSVYDELVEQQNAQQRSTLESQVDAMSSRAQDTLNNEPDDALVPSANARIARQNLGLIEQQQALLEQVGQAQEQSRSLKKRLDTITSLFRSIQQQLAFEGATMNARQRAFILAARDKLDAATTQEEINNLRVENDLIDAQGAILDSALSVVDVGSVDEALQQDNDRLVEQTVAVRKQVILALSDVVSYQQQINRQIDNNWQVIYQQLLRNPISEPVSFGWVGEVFTGTIYVLRYSASAITLELFDPTLLTGFGVMLLGVWAIFVAYLARHYHHRKEDWAAGIGNVLNDKTRHTLAALVLPLAMTSLIPLTLLLVATTLESSSMGPILEELLWVLAFALWAGWVLYRYLEAPSGICVAHFDMDEKIAGYIRRRTNALLSFALPLALVSLWTWNIDSEVVRSGPYRLSMALLVISFGLFWLSFWRFRDRIDDMFGRHWWSASRFWIVLLVGFNVVMFLLILLGYALTVGVFILSLMKAIGVCLLTAFSYKVGLRWLLITKRRLQFEQIKAKRAERIAARENPEEETPLDTNYINMQSVSEQSRTLLRVATFIAFVSLMYLALGEYLPFIDSLDALEIWRSTNVDGEVIATITLKSILVGGMVLGFSLLAAYNLPGLLELTVLSRLDLSPGTGYALTTLTKYSLIVFGIVSACSHFGLEWNKLQWLVAALGVGLGFGLQEIVANFVSGLIILFEKPMRIGDTVTIDGLTGNVTRIQIRATTIVDWDRKEVIIPNKSFITQQLINWSLTDSVTRLVIPVGVAYGSDTEKARALLLEAAKENSKVLSDPEPAAFFLGFGASTLDFDLRLHVSAMADRLEVTHQVNTAIDAKFKAAGIEIAFNQLDVHMRYPDKANDQPLTEPKPYSDQD